MIDRNIIKVLNHYLHMQNAKFFVGLIGNGDRLCWLKSTELKDEKPLFQIKVKTEFIQSLIDLIELHHNIAFRDVDPDNIDIYNQGYEYDETLDQNIYTLFQENAIGSTVPQCKYYDRCGIIVGKFAEFSIRCNPDEIISYTVGSLDVRISRISFLLRNLIVDHDDDNLMYIEDDITIKITGTSLETIHQDLASCMYYLQKISPLHYEPSGWPMITVFQGEVKDFPIYAHDFIEDRNFPSPKSPKAVQFFYAAETADSMGQNDVAILNYYRSIEHFFDEAWHRKISQVLIHAGNNVNLIASELQNNTPKRDIDYLSLIINQTITNDIWTYVDEIAFCEHTENALTNKIYALRNKVAHGRDEESRGNIPHPPSIIPVDTLDKSRKLFGLIAKNCLITYNNMT